MSTYTSVSLQAYRKCSILHVYLLIKMFWFGLFETFKTGVFTVLEHLENQGTPNETFTGPGKFIEMNKILKGMDISIVSIILFNLNSLVQTVLCEWVFYSKVFVRILDKLWKCISQKVWEPWNKHCSVCPAGRVWREFLQLLPLRRGTAPFTAPGSTQWQINPL